MWCFVLPADAGAAAAAAATSPLCRSAVARQAAHMYEVLAAALGFSFESYAVACMTALFKAMVITVQVGVGAPDCKGSWPA
jgi:hypothetical protein